MEGRDEQGVVSRPILDTGLHLLDVVGRVAGRTHSTAVVVLGQVSQADEPGVIRITGKE